MKTGERDSAIIYGILCPSQSSAPASHYPEGEERVLIRKYQEVSGRGQNRGISPLSLPLLLILFQKIFDCDPTSLLLANHLLEREKESSAEYTEKTNFSALVLSPHFLIRTAEPEFCRYAGVEKTSESED